MLLQQLINGLVIGSTYALVTIGFNMVYGVLELTNFAHSSFYMLAAYIGQFILLKFFMNISVPIALIITFLTSIIITAFLGALMDKIALEPIRIKKGAPISSLISTVGVQTIINNSVLLIFGTVPLYFPDLLKLGKFTIYGGTVVQWIQVLILVMTLIIMLVLTFIVTRTRLGKSMRAISQNQVAARLMGININRVITLTFFIGTTVAGISGLMVAMYYQRVDTLMGASVGLKSFAAAVLGGMGSLPGAAIGGLLIGLLETLFAAYISSGYRDIVAFVILILVLLIRPSGLMGKKSVDKV
ncbi:branched-chain amino acid ABC transporter permease [Treponema putidum]|uniref:Branched-chain amino acid ABC transporter permease n=1 Tax=Treponema putidum TaxID=221027 RepID=A0ABY5HU51_9SPIR|nr:branched-chain amino acid ABC transporter permease [Treponema putidum]AIN94145.1 ABC transporter permease [Treponema putidum]TWI79606.1 amino acid/amide ABC transporter membrane protein 1 (HAAT family) [Treponema putidum]UTY28094.1 branched-chain amino acid ABC transporter permease [Treponema putidum]UTY30593.1 branched-chain amino acid ABC transporter permease [Treponema putidum]